MALGTAEVGGEAVQPPHVTDGKKDEVAVQALDRPAHELPHPGDGHLKLSIGSSSKSIITAGSGLATFSHLTATYPLKLLPPTRLPSQPPSLGVCYMLAYGGGLVGGDEISLKVEVGKAARLMLLTQGSTKVFKTRGGLRPASSWHRGQKAGGNDKGSSSSKTKQRLHITLQSDSILLLLPDPIQPFRDSSYAQAQRFVIPAYRTALQGVNPPTDQQREAGRGEFKSQAEGTCPNPASLLVLDWFTSGRKHSRTRPQAGAGVQTTGIPNDGVPNGISIVRDPASSPFAFEEEWDFERYSSLNEVVDTDGRIVMRERLVLERETASPSSIGTSTASTSLANRLLPYTIYATLLIHGPAFQTLLSFLTSLTLSPSSTQFQASKPDTLLWSFSEVDHDREADNLVARGGVLRVAGVETEAVKAFLAEVLVKGGVKDLVGDAIWERVF